MKIISNATNLDNKKLQSLFSAVHNRLAKYEGRLGHWKTLKVAIDSRAYGYSGLAYVGRGQIFKHHDWDIELKCSKGLSLESLAQLFAHELMHSYGYRDTKQSAGIRTKGRVFNRKPLLEKDMDFINQKFGELDFQRIEKPKVKIDKVALRKERAKSNLANWEKKLGFAKNKVKKYQAKVRYYEKKGA